MTNSRFAYWIRVLSLLLIAASLPIDAIAADRWDEESPSGARRNGTPDIRIYERGDLIAFDVRDAPLDQVLRHLAARAGFRLEISGGPLDRRVTRSLHAVPVKEAIDRLLENVSYVMTTSDTRYAGASMPRVDSVIVLTRRGVVISDPPARPSIFSRADPLTDAERRKRDRERSEASVKEVRELVKAGTISAAERLADIVTYDSQSGVRRMAARELTRMNRDGPNIIAALMSAADDPSPWVRMAGLRGLYWKMGAEAETIFVDARDLDEELFIRQFAARLLNALDHPPRVDAAGKPLTRDN